MGEIGVARVWFQCYENGYFEKCPKTLLFRQDISALTRRPTHINPER